MKRAGKQITVISKDGAIEEIAETAGVTPEAATKIVKLAARRFYLHGRHPNSLKNLKPQRRGAQGKNPWGRAGKNSLQAQLETALYGPSWRRFVRETEKTQKLLEQSFKEQFGISLRAAERRAYGR
jgi:hypothetical protein